MFIFNDEDCVDECPEGSFENTDEQKCEFNTIPLVTIINQQSIEDNPYPLKGNHIIELEVVTFYPIISYTWDLEDATKFERTQFFRDTIRFNDFLEIKGENLLPGQKYQILVTVQGEMGTATLHLEIKTISLPPITLEVSPLEGTSMETEFTIVSKGWSVLAAVEFSLDVVDAAGEVTNIKDGFNKQTIQETFNFPYIGEQSVFTF